MILGLVGVIFGTLLVGLAGYILGYAEGRVAARKERTP